MRIDFVSDIACPWCAIGAASLEQALQQLHTSGTIDAAEVELHVQPFELNPAMPPAGRDAAQYLKAKYGMDDAQLAEARARLRERGAEVGFTFGERDWVWNTFDGHRVLHWAGLLPGDAQWRLKRALLAAYHRDGRNPASREMLAEAAAAVGLEPADALRVVDEGRFADEVREAEAQWQQAGIQAVPSVVVDGRHLIQGGQPVAAYVQALSRLLESD